MHITTHAQYPTQYKRRIRMLYYMTSVLPFNKRSVISLSSAHHTQELTPSISTHFPLQPSDWNSPLHKLSRCPFPPSIPILAEGLAKYLGLSLSPSAYTVLNQLLSLYIDTLLFLFGTPVNVEACRASTPTLWSYLWRNESEHTRG